MRIKLKFKSNSNPKDVIMNSHINGFVNKVLGENNKWHGTFSPYCVSGMHNGVLQSDGTLQYPSGGYFVVSSSNSEFIGEFLKGLLTLEDETSILSMKFDGFDPYDPQVMSDYSIIHFENIYLQRNRKDEEKKIYTFENCDDYLTKLKENTVQKLVKEGMNEHTANSLEFIPFHPEGWKVKYCKYKMMDNHPLVHPVSNISLIVKGNKKARKMLCDMGMGNSTGYGFGFARLKEDNE